MDCYQGQCVTHQVAYSFALKHSKALLISAARWRDREQLSQSESRIEKGISILLVNDRPGVEPPSIRRSLRAYPVKSADGS
jgi:hypothetical protein